MKKRGKSLQPLQQVTERVSYLLGTNCKQNQQETLVRLSKESVSWSMISQTFSGSSMLGKDHCHYCLSSASPNANFLRVKV